MKNFTVGYANNRPSTGFALKAHTLAVLALTGLSSGAMAAPVTLKTLWGPTAIGHHSKQGNVAMVEDGGKPYYTLTAKGLAHFTKREPGLDPVMVQKFVKGLLGQTDKEEAGGKLYTFSKVTLPLADGATGRMVALLKSLTPSARPAVETDKAMKTTTKAPAKAATATAKASKPKAKTKAKDAPMTAQEVTTPEESRIPMKHFREFMGWNDDDKGGEGTNT